MFGPIAGHASDGDRRSKLLMLYDYKLTIGLRLKVDWEGWLPSGGLSDGGHA